MKCHIIPGDTGTALQPLGNKCCVANTWQNWEQKPKVFLSPAPSPTSLHFSHFSEISVTGRQLRKCDFYSHCSRSPLGKHPLCSIHMRHGGVSGLLLNPTANGLDFWKIFLYPPHSMAPVWVQLPENTEYLNAK